MGSGERAHARGDRQQGDEAGREKGQADIAALAAMSRNAVHFYLAELVEQGLIEIGCREIRVTRPARLRALLEAEE